VIFGCKSKIKMHLELTKLYLLISLQRNVVAGAVNQLRNSRVQPERSVNTTKAREKQTAASALKP
jgi:hypothetical protein